MGIYDDIERVVVYINDDRKEVNVDIGKLDIPMPSGSFLFERFVEPFSVLNHSKHYIYQPNEKQKQAIIQIQEIVNYTLT